jgi:hypothetical protein
MGGIVLNTSAMQVSGQLHISTSLQPKKGPVFPFGRTGLSVGLDEMAKNKMFFWDSNLGHPIKLTNIFCGKSHTEYFVTE